MLTRSYVKMALSFAIISNIAVTTQKYILCETVTFLRIASSRRNREERRFVDLRIILILW